MIRYLRLLLLPFSLLYGLVVVLRNLLYDLGIFRVRQFQLPVICVGNLVVGGAGKTPVTEYLVNLLSDRRIAILSRGYGRNTKGYILADRLATAETIGDEPMQFYNKFPNVTVAVCEDRAKGLGLLESDHDLVILDDAFQHRSVKPGFSILLFEYQKLLDPQFLLPAGNLREPFSGYKRADALLVTKMPETAGAQDKRRCQQQFSVPFRQKLFFSNLAYGELTGVFSTDATLDAVVTDKTKVFLITGIANPQPLVSYLTGKCKKIQHFDYPDHYKFRTEDIKKLISAFNSDPSPHKLIITTEKDAQRLRMDGLKELLLNLPVFYLPIKIALADEDKATFDQKILNYVSGITRNR
jgi:tetraacyldisaccharide 4'-kinase